MATKVVMVVVVVVVMVVEVVAAAKVVVKRSGVWRPGYFGPVWRVMMVEKNNWQ